MKRKILAYQLILKLFCEWEGITLSYKLWSLLTAKSNINGHGISRSAFSSSISGRKFGFFPKIILKDKIAKKKKTKNENKPLKSVPKPQSTKKQNQQQTTPKPPTKPNHATINICSALLLLNICQSADRAHWQYFFLLDSSKIWWPFFCYLKNLKRKTVIILYQKLQE